MLIRLCALCLLAGLSTACADKLINPTPTTPGSLASARKYLEGRWSLESFELFPPGGAPTRLTASGTLTYDDFSNLKMEIHADAKSAQALQQSGIVMQDDMISSNGRVAVDVPNQTITYVMEGQPAGFAATGPLALTRPRHWVVDGNVLTLTTRDTDGKALSVSRWRKQP